jgi:hypothetical protein
VPGTPAAAAEGRSNCQTTFSLDAAGLQYLAQTSLNGEVIINHEAPRERRFVAVQK